MAHHARVRPHGLLEQHRALTSRSPLAWLLCGLPHDPHVLSPRSRAGAARQREAHDGDGTERTGSTRRVAREVAHNAEVAVAAPLAREVTLAADRSGQVALPDWALDAVGGGGDVGVLHGATRAATRAANRITVAGP